MPVIVKAQGSDSTYDVIKKFKKASASADTVQKARDRRFFQKPSKKRAIKKIEVKRLRRRARSLKKMKNVSAASIQRIMDRINTL